MQRMYVIKGRKMMLGLIKKEQKWEIALQTTLGFKLSWSSNRLFKTRTTVGQSSLFSSKSHTFGLGQKIWTNTFGVFWGIFCQFIRTHFGTLSPLSIFLQKSLYTQIVYRSPWFNNHKISNNFLVWKIHKMHVL